MALARVLVDGFSLLHKWAELAPGKPGHSAAARYEVVQVLTHYGEVLVITDDFKERDTVLSLGGMASSCLNFIQTVQAVLAELEHKLRMHNLREKSRFDRSR